ncbi:cobalamin biosynthesis protein [Streptomyces sp. NRRL S-350]|uniref:cobalamin biosynthesis protein n=1 Tax=Streptomyces sp. NRRL S-350 TaxID=1463902 RepID=UPI00068EAA76|nr:cobalamin biosynthesis protein [Streptomyces sp. NRRL S-350]
MIGLVTLGATPAPTGPAAGADAAATGTDVHDDTGADAPVLRVTGQEDPDHADLLPYPRTLVVGIGAGTAAEPAEAMRLVADALQEAGLAHHSVARLATVAGKAAHPAVRWVAHCLGGVPVDEHPRERLAAVPVPNPSPLVGAAVGTTSVAEAAALASTPGGRLVVAKRKSATATVAIAQAPSVPGRPGSATSPEPPGSPGPPGSANSPGPPGPLGSASSPGFPTDPAHPHGDPT